MNSERKNIRIVLILLAGLAILLHSIVSHHHHSDLFSDNSSVFNTNQIPGESSDEANKHCHAFNNIITEKVTSKTFDTKIESNFNLIFVSVIGIFLSINKVEQTTFFIQDIVIIKQYFRTVQSFRGPPALA